jgi:diguanylate cyclase (GGDEF)-like protein/PAS domain S-box-containing protein
MIYVHDLRGTILSVNAAVERLTGYTRAELIGKNAARFVAPEALPLVRAAFNLKIGELHHVKPFEIEIVCKDGARLPVEISARLVRADDTVVALEGIARDMRERKRAEAIIRHMAFYDTLTNLPNRVLFDEYLRHALALATQHHTALAVLFVDLDRFKLINDALGHHTGDLLLEAVPQRLLGCVRPGDTVARMGGDEFTVLLPNITSTDDAALVAQRLLDALTAPFTIGGHELFVSASIGISVFPADGGDAETLLKHADTAMYRAKEGGRSGYQFYTPAMNAATHKQHQLEQRLRRALERDEFRLVYQPRIDPHTGALLGAEALLRWQHPEFGLIGPADFIGVAEDTGLIMPIGLWVLRTACQQAKAWRQTGAPLRMAVNLSARQFQHTNLAAQVAAVLADTGLPAHALELEITESMAMHNAERTVVVLRALKELGVHLSVDDFGTGYSSLSYLKQFDVDTLKIDRGFVCDLPHDSAIAEAVLALAHSLSMSVTAEGVETEEQLAFLQQHNCDEVQGFLIGKPVPADQFAPLFMQGNKVIRRHGAIGTR